MVFRFWPFSERASAEIRSALFCDMRPTSRMFATRLLVFIVATPSAARPIMTHLSAADAVHAPEESLTMHADALPPSTKSDAGSFGAVVGAIRLSTHDVVSINVTDAHTSANHSRIPAAEQAANWWPLPLRLSRCLWVFGALLATMIVMSSVDSRSADGASDGHQRNDALRKRHGGRSLLTTLLLSLCLVVAGVGVASQTDRILAGSDRRLQAHSDHCNSDKDCTGGYCDYRISLTGLDPSNSAEAVFRCRSGSRSWFLADESFIRSWYGRQRTSPFARSRRQARQSKTGF
jgi:hypothetical protein